MSGLELRVQVPVVNADQSVILIWDAATRTEHFIRKASFKSAGDELGFVVPTPMVTHCTTALLAALFLHLYP